MAVRVTGTGPACCNKGLKCINKPPAAWDIVVPGGSGTITRSDAGLQLIAASTNYEIVQESGPAIDPNKDFEFVANLKWNGGPELVVGLASSDVLSFIQIELLTTGIINIAWSRGGAVFSQSLGASAPGGEIVKYIVRKKGSLVRVEVPGLVAKELSITNLFPTTLLRPTFGAVSLSTTLSNGVLAAFCAGKLV